LTFTHDRSQLFSRRDPEDPRLGDVAQIVTLPEFEKRHWDWAIIGLPDDRGVALNGGRPGAAEGPNAIRKWLYRLVPPRHLALADLGDLGMTDDLDADHRTATSAIAAALGHADKVAVLGGGHDWGYCPIAALMQGGIAGFVNFDAHLDVRASKVHHSGTSYWRALESGINGENAFWYGVQMAATAAAHRQYVEAHGGLISWADSLDPEADGFLTSTDARFGEFAEGCDYLDVSLDMDVFSSASAPGVSAPQPLGLSPEEIIVMLSSVFSAPKLRTVGIYETAPPLDLPGEPTSRLAARCLWEALSV
jgi:formiminoglutamase